MKWQPVKSVNFSERVFLAQLELIIATFMAKHRTQFEADAKYSLQLFRVFRSR